MIWEIFPCIFSFLRTMSSNCFQKCTLLCGVFLKGYWSIGAWVDNS